MYLKVSQGNSLGNYVKQAKKCHFLCKIRQQEGRTGPAGVGVWGFDMHERGKREEMCKSVNMMQILCKHECKWKKVTF
jgi:hypothetical protein